LPNKKSGNLQATTSTDAEYTGSEITHLSRAEQHCPTVQPWHPPKNSNSAKFLKSICSKEAGCTGHKDPHHAL